VFLEVKDRIDYFKNEVWMQGDTKPDLEQVDEWGHHALGLQQATTLPTVARDVAQRPRTLVLYVQIMPANHPEFNIHFFHIHVCTWHQQNYGVFFTVTKV